MTIFDEVAGKLGGPQRAQQELDRLAQGQANFDDPRSPDFNTWNELVGSAPPPVTQDAFEQAARQVDDREYHEHITPGVRGTDPLGGLGQGALSTIAGALLDQFMRSQGTGGVGGRSARDTSGTGRAGGAGGIDLSQLTRLIPGLRTTDPGQMSPDEVARMAEYMQRNHPDAFGRAASEIGRREPSLLESLLGNKALMLGAAVLGAKILADRAARNRAGAPSARRVRETV